MEEVSVTKINSSWHPTMVWNGSIATIWDMKAEISWILIPKLALVFLMVAEIVLGWKLTTIIIKYLKNKPPGEQQAMDIFHQITFESLRHAGVILSIHVTLEYLFLDTGDIIAMIWMWPTYTSAAMVFNTLGFNPMLQMVLSRQTAGDFCISNKWIYWLVVSTLWTSLLVLSIVCSASGCYPPDYFTMRGLDVQHPAFYALQIVPALVLLVTFLIQCLKKDENLSRVHQIKMKAIFAMLVGSSVAVIFNFHTTVAIIIFFVFLICLPSLVISTNEHILEIVKNKHHQTERLVIRIRNFILRDSSSVEPKINSANSSARALHMNQNCVGSKGDDSGIVQLPMISIERNDRVSFPDCPPPPSSPASSHSSLDSERPVVLEPVVIIVNPK